MRMKRPMPQMATPKDALRAFSPDPTRMSAPQQAPMPTQSQSNAAALRGTPQQAPMLAGGMGGLGGAGGAGLAGMARPQQGMTQSQSQNAALAGKPQVVPPSAMSGLSGMGATGMGARAMGMKKGGSVKSSPTKTMASGGKVSSASKRADGCAIKGKTKGRIV